MRRNPADHPPAVTAGFGQRRAIGCRSGVRARSTFPLDLDCSVRVLTRPRPKPKHSGVPRDDAVARGTLRIRGGHRPGQPSAPTDEQPEPPRTPNWRGGLQPLGLAAIAAAGCAYIALVNPNTSGAYPQCPLHAITGYDCPGCGLTRAGLRTHARQRGTSDRSQRARGRTAAARHPRVRAVDRGSARLRHAAATEMAAVDVGGRGVVVFGFFIVRNLPGFEYLRATAS